MSCVTGWSFTIPTHKSEMDDQFWFNLWSKKLWPYREVEQGDGLYWYKPPTKAIVWRTQVTEIACFPYDAVTSALDRLDQMFGGRLDRSRSAPTEFTELAVSHQGIGVDVEKA